MEHKAYLTEESLLIKIIELLNNDYEIIHNKKFLNYRPDIRIDKLKLIIEFDGYLHYTNSKTCIKDILKDNDYKNAGYNVIRIPYFVQWCNQLASLIMSTDINNILQTYPHGFINEKATLPADFCWLGLQRFIKDLDVHLYAKQEIINNLSLLISQRTDLNVNEIIPAPLYNILF